MRKILLTFAAMIVVALVSLPAFGQQRLSARLDITNAGSGSQTSGMVAGIQAGFSDPSGAFLATDIAVGNYLHNQIGGSIYRWRVTGITTATPFSITFNVAFDDPQANFPLILDSTPIGAGDSVITEPLTPGGPSIVPSQSRLQISEALVQGVNTTNAFYEGGDELTPEQEAGIQEFIDGQFVQFDNYEIANGISPVDWIAALGITTITPAQSAAIASNTIEIVDNENDIETNVLDIDANAADIVAAQTALTLIANGLPRKADLGMDGLVLPDQLPPTITASQASEIAANTLKNGVTPEQSTAVQQVIDGDFATATSVSDLSMDLQDFQGDVADDLRELLPLAGGTVTGPITSPNGTAPGHLINLAQLEGRVTLTDNPDGTCTLQVGPKAVTVGTADNPPAAMMLDAGSVEIGQTITGDLSTVVTAGDNPTLSYALDGGNPKASAISLNLSTGEFTINTAGLTVGEVCVVQYVVTDGSMLNSVSSIQWTQTALVPRADLTVFPADTTNLTYSFRIDHENLDGTEEFRYFAEDGTDVSALVTSTGLPEGAVPGTGTTITFGLPAVYQTLGLQRITARLFSPSQGTIEEFVYPEIVPSGKVAYANITGDLATGQTADLEILGIKIGTVTTGAGYTAGGLSGTSLNGIHPAANGPIVSNWTLDREFGSYTITTSGLNGTNNRFESITYENTSNASDVLVPLIDPTQTSSGTNPVTLTTSDTSNAAVNATFTGGAISSLRATQAVTTSNGSVITRISLNAAPPKSIIILGDSRMASQHMVPSLEEVNRTFFTLRNDAVSGHTILQFHAVVDSLVAAGEHFDQAIVMIGTNSAGPGGIPTMFPQLQAAIQAGHDGGLWDELLLFNDSPASVPLITAAGNKRPALRLYRDNITNGTWPAGTTVLNSFDGLEDPNMMDELNPIYTVDGLHFLRNGYDEVITPLLDPFVNQ